MEILSDQNHPISQKYKRSFIFIIFTALPIFWIFITSYQDFTGYSTLYLALGLMFNTAIQAIVISRLETSQIPSISLLAGVLSVFLIALNFRFNALPVFHIAKNFKIILLILSALLPAACLLMRRGTKFALIFACILLAQALAVQWYKKAFATNSQLLTTRVKSTPKTHRNIYLLGLDSMPGSSYYSKHFNSSPPWSDMLRHEGFRTISDAYSSQAATFETYYSMMSLNKTDKNATTEVVLQSFFKQSFLNSLLPIYQKVDSEGYKIQFMFHSPYFGVGKHQNLDYYYPDKKNSEFFCPFSLETLGFYLCNIDFLYMLDRQINKGPLDNNKNSSLHGYSIARMLPTVYDRIRLIASDQTPWLSITHLWEPGHTLGEYLDYDPHEHASFQQTFQIRSEDAAQDAQKIITLIKSVDKHDPIIIIYGDHGPYLSRNWEVDAKVRERFNDNELFQDRHGVGLYVYPINFCENKIKNQYQLTNIISDVFDCIENNGVSK